MLLRSSRDRCIARSSAPRARLSILAAGALLAACANTISTDPATGQRLAHDWQKGNCLACHQIPRDPKAATMADIGPPLEDLKSRFPNRAALRAQIADARGRNPQTVMPPFGTARILSDAEIEHIIDYLYAY